MEGVIVVLEFRKAVENPLKSERKEQTRLSTPQTARESRFGKPTFCPTFFYPLEIYHWWCGGNYGGVVEIILRKISAILCKFAKYTKNTQKNTIFSRAPPIFSLYNPSTTTSSTLCYYLISIINITGMH